MTEHPLQISSTGNVFGMRKIFICMLVLMLPAATQALQNEGWDSGWRQTSATSTTTSMPPFRIGTRQIVQQIAPGVIAWNFTIPWRRRLSATSTGYSFGFNTAYTAGGLGSRTALENFLNPLSQIGTGYGTTVNIPASGPAQAASFPIVGSGLQGVAIVPPAADPALQSATNPRPVGSIGASNNTNLPIPVAPIPTVSVQPDAPSVRMDDGIFNTGIAYPNVPVQQQMASPSQPNTPYTNVLTPVSVPSLSTQNGLYEAELPFNANTNLYPPNLQPTGYPGQNGTGYSPHSYPTAPTRNEAYGNYASLPPQSVPLAPNNE
ncbi:hypothetical protein RvY_15801 [Ramazzottius varieornatus]|uniref:Uncharacterized protein n=1 Tax=Ramazzottius varieornatus TaxID=947166 RepID=A0A1D1VXB6_RAMVA|nr:hypothetical protein RvY_15801 [Ramazzottius varieornatus]